MVTRKHITLNYQYNDNWIGGTYYILNIIRSLDLLDDEDKPKLTIIHDENTNLKEITAINYPFINFIEINTRFNFFQRITNKIAVKIFGRNLFTKTLPSKLVSNFYPVPEYIDPTNLDKYYYWIPDFQERHLPEFFSAREVKQRFLTQMDIVKKQVPVIFSSYNAQKDFNTFYPENKNDQTVLQFVSLIGKQYKNIKIQSLREKFGITKPYFIVCNQFWKHKNHYTVVNAIINHKDADKFQVLFTGKEHDHRNPNFPKELRNYINSNNLGNEILYLGFLDRDEQLKLMDNSIAIIQPSLFEGWSTVVEDAKALNHLILVSDIPIHREQISKNCIFFEPKNSNSLALKMSEALLIRKTEDLYYDQNIRDFGLNFISIFP